jgi:hypothetical protein
MTTEEQMKPLILSMLIVAGLSSGFAYAEDRSGSWRQNNQQQRIQQGWRSGDLSGNEVRRLQGEQRQIRQERRQYAADGHVDRVERADLRRDLNRADRHIYNERHDGNRRGWNGHWDNGRHNGWVNGRHVGWDNDRNVRGGERRSAGWVDRSQWQQREMIERGVRSGRITPVEYRQLQAEQRSIRQEERAYRSDGRLSGAERADLSQDLQSAWRNISAEMRDGNGQYNYGR